MSAGDTTSGTGAPGAPPTDSAELKDEIAESAREASRGIASPTCNSAVGAPGQGLEHRIFLLILRPPHTLQLHTNPSFARLLLSVLGNAQRGAPDGTAGGADESAPCWAVGSAGATRMGPSVVVGTSSGSGSGATSSYKLERSR